MATITRDISIGPDTDERLIYASTCTPLISFGIYAVGVVGASDPRYCMSRPEPRKCLLVATLSGSGRGLVEGRLSDLLPGTAYFAPAHVPHRYESTGQPWSFAWIEYTTLAARERFPALDEPRVIPFPSEPLRDVIRVLLDERQTRGDLDVIHATAQLIDAMARRSAVHWQHQDRLAAVWRLVEADLGRRWSLRELCRIAGLSAEALRLACLQSVGRSPMRHVAWLRMNRAAAQLVAEDIPVHKLAECLGYEDPFAFSAAFKRAMGRAPSAFRDGGDGAPRSRAPRWRTRPS